MKRDMTVHYGDAVWDVTFHDYGDEVELLRVEADLQDIGTFLSEDAVSGIIDAIFDRKIYGNGWPEEKRGMGV